MIPISFVQYQNHLEINGRGFDLGWPINYAIALQDRVIVTVEHYDLPKTDPQFGRNVFALDRNGRELWRIEASPAIFMDDQGRKCPFPYIYLQRSPDGRGLWIDNQSGIRCDLDPATGALSNPRRFEK